MATNRSHQVACHGDSVVWRVKQGTGSPIAGACGARVKFSKELLLICAFWMSASTGASASTDLPLKSDLPPKSLSFAYRVTHPVFPLSQAAIASLRDPDGDALVPDESTAADYDEPTPPDVGAKPRVPTQPELCRTVADVANAHNLPVPFFANLIWAESSFNAKVISRAGAQGIAQFMPRTAVMYGLDNPFDSIHAIKVSARFLTQLREQFGNLGLAAAAYNAGPRRVTNWLANRGGLPRETQNYVRKITGRPVEQWVGAEAVARAEIDPMPAKAPCIEVAEAVLEQTRVARIANLMRELAASVPPPEETVGTVRDRGKVETKIAAKSDRRELRLGKLRPSVKDLRSRTEMAAAKPNKLEASSSRKRGADRRAKTWTNKTWTKLTKKSDGKAASKAPSKTPDKEQEKVAPAKVAAANAAAKPAAKPDNSRQRHRATRRMRFAYTVDNRLH
jgi:Transglycosylase SLT domain